MKIIHRVSDRGNHHRCLRSLGIEPKLTDGDFFSFDIEEASPFWPEVARLIHEWKAVDIVRTTFSHNELASAALLQLNPSWHHGYPQPEDEYKKAIYDTAHYCEQCGVGGVQRAPFRMRGEPKWGTKQILQLNWVFGEYFVTPDTWERVFKPLGVEQLLVFNHRTGLPLKTVVQLLVPARATAPIDPDRLPTETCQVCKRTKYQPIARGRFPHVWLPKGAHMAKTIDWFGSGGSGWQAVIVSSQVYEGMQAHKVRGAEFTVVCDASQERV